MCLFVDDHGESACIRTPYRICRPVNGPCVAILRMHRGRKPHLLTDLLVGLLAGDTEITVGRGLKSAAGGIPRYSFNPEIL